MHCASGDYDLGHLILNLGYEFSFSFKMNFFQITRFFYHFWWGEKQNVLDVFNRHLTDHCSIAKPRMCYWKVLEDGFYAGGQFNQLGKLYDWK